MTTATTQCMTRSGPNNSGANSGVGLPAPVKPGAAPLLTVDPDAGRLQINGQGALLHLWRSLVKGHLVDPQDLSARRLEPWRNRLIIFRRLPGPLRFDITLCGDDICDALAGDAVSAIRSGAMVDTLISTRTLPRDLYSGLQQCIDRRCPVHQVIGSFEPGTAAPQALYLPVGRNPKEPSHVLTLLENFRNTSSGCGSAWPASANGHDAASADRSGSNANRIGIDQRAA